jgi:hypothetical protein
MRIEMDAVVNEYVLQALEAPPRLPRSRHVRYRAVVVPIGNSILLATDIESGDAPALCERFVA